ncbi:MAG TPA: hypothetical protein DEO54_00155 [Rikenellaceae bacterium]|nr:MAG: hypothetical protein A2X20_01890 [Bacteroidetes bacterium GWE2_40_15]HBZ24633.1 hypothetical protein [Rikenellaceae bacterium]
MKDFVLIALISFIFFGCKNQDKTQIIDLDRNDKVSIFDLVDSISVVKLETNENCLLSFLIQGTIYKNRFYFFDYKQRIIFCFDNNGKFLYKINKFGRGSDEYEAIASFSIDKFNDQIMILVPYGSILYYDLDGKFISKEELPSEIIAYNEVHSINKDVLLFISNNKIRAAYYSKSDKRLIKRFLEVTPEQKEVFSPLRRTYNYKDSIYYNDYTNNTVINISNITDNQIRHKWDFGENNNTKEQLQEFILYKANQKKNKELIDWKEVISNKKFYNHFPGSSFESNTFIGMSLNYKGPIKYVFYNKLENSYKVFGETKEGVSPYLNLTSNNSIINTYSDKNNEIFKKILSEKQKNIIESHNPDTDNPFLVIYHIK